MASQKNVSAGASTKMRTAGKRALASLVVVFAGVALAFAPQTAATGASPSAPYAATEPSGTPGAANATPTPSATAAVATSPAASVTPGKSSATATRRATPTRSSATATQRATATERATATGGAAATAAATPTPSASSTTSAASPLSGIDAYKTLGCGGCHRLAAAGTVGGLGPTHEHIATTAESRIIAPDYEGAATTAEEYLQESIRDNDAYIVPAFRAVKYRMPDYSFATDAQVQAIVQFLLTQK